VRSRARSTRRAIKAGPKGATPAQRKPFHYFDKGSMGTVSRFSAVAKVGPLELAGIVAWLAWLLPPISSGHKQSDHRDFVDSDLPDHEPGPTRPPTRSSGQRRLRTQGARDEF
jgi:hypothetical protein